MAAEGDSDGEEAAEGDPGPAAKNTNNKRGRDAGAKDKEGAEKKAKGGEEGAGAAGDEKKEKGKFVPGEMAVPPSWGKLYCQTLLML